MEVHIDPLQKQMLDDVFDAFSMLSSRNLVTLTHIESGVTRWSPGAVELFGLPGEYVPNSAVDLNGYIHPEDRKRCMDVMAPLAGGETHSYDVTCRVRTKSGEYYNIRSVGSVLRSGEGVPNLVGGILINQGLTENTDPITVLRNKVGLIEDVKARIAAEDPTVMLLLGIGQLGDINRTYGYSYGNRVLQEVAWLIQETVADRGTVYRAGDATFAVIADGLSRGQVAAIYDSIRLKLQQGIRVYGVRNILRASGGMISAQGERMDAETLYSCLHYAYLESKRRRGELVDFNGAANYDVREALEKINTIRNCIVEGCQGFLMSYQPVVHARSEKLLAVEALVRWEGEPYGVVEPMEFLPVLERDFVFEELGYWILHQAVTDGKRFLEKAPDLIVSVNISSAQLEDEYFIDSVTQTLEETGFPAKNLCFEITKECRMLDVAGLSRVVDALHERGVRVVIDDFGAGFESIAFLKRLNADFIKFDRALVEGIETSGPDRLTMKYLALLADIRGTQVLAKGVETEGEHDILRDFTVRGMQGKFFSEALPPDALIRHYLS